MAKNVNSPYSQDTITPSQRGEQLLAGHDGSYIDGWATVESVENAHDQQNAPTSLYAAPLDNNTTNAPAAAPVADRAAPYDATRTTKPAHPWVVDAIGDSNGSGA